MFFIDTKNSFKVNQHNWNLDKYGYARTTIFRKTIHLHRFILNAPKDRLVDHKDSNPLNCLESNLRLGSCSNNAWNKQITILNKSGFKGVSWKKSNNAWVAQIAYNKHKIYLGLFITKELAAIAYNRAAVKYHKNFAVLSRIYPCIGFGG